MQKKLILIRHRIEKWMPFYIVLMLFSIGTVSCEVIPITIPSQPRPPQISDVLWLPTSEMLVAGGADGIYSSRDKGENWSFTPIMIVQLQRFANEHIWGWYFYPHPHGGPPAISPYLVYSADGLHWDKIAIDFDGEDPEPLTFLTVSADSPPYLITTSGAIWQYDESKDPTSWNSWSLLKDMRDICYYHVCTTGMKVENTIYLGYRRISSWENGPPVGSGILTITADQQESFFFVGHKGVIQRFWQEGNRCWVQYRSGHLYAVQCGQNDWKFVEKRESIPFDSLNGQFPTLVNLVNDELFQVITTYTDPSATLWVGTTHGLFRQDGENWIRVLPLTQ